MNDVSAYHVTANEYDVGNIHRLEGTSSFVTKLLEDCHFNNVEKVIEKVRPPKAQSRLSSLFAYPTLGACSAYWQAEKATGKAYYQLAPIFYRVILPSPTSVPSTLLSKISHHIQFKLSYDDIIHEFWFPSKRWECMEYMDSEFTVLEEVPSPKMMETYVYQISSQSDFNLANKYWPNSHSEASSSSI